MKFAGAGVPVERITRALKMAEVADSTRMFDAKDELSSSASKHGR